MAGVVVTVLIFFLLVGGVGGAAYLIYAKKLRRAKAIERGLKMVPILIHLPPPSSDTQSGTRDIREVMREKTSQAEVLYNLLAGTATEGFKSNFYGQRHIALELIVSGGLVHFFAAVPVALVGVVKQAVTTAYPGARLEEVEDHNIFNKEGRLAATLGGEMVLRANTAYPIATYEQLERDPMEAILTAVSALEKQDGVAVQIMLRPAGQGWVKQALALADSLRQGKTAEFKFSAMDLAKAALKAPSERRDEERLKNGGAPQVSQLQLSQVERIEEKTKHPGFEVLVRVIVSTGSVMRSQQLLREISTAFALYESPGLNGFKFLPAVDVQGLVTAFIFRFFPNELKSNVLSSAELATLFHLPDAQFTPSASVARQQSKQVDGPVRLPATGLLFGYNEFRGARKEIRLSPEDRRRHTYILGQTGTGKSTMLENLAVQDMVAGNGFAFIDPHGDSAEKLLALVPKERAEDVIYFNPADTMYPLGLNLFEFTDPAQKDFLVQETINMLYKLYDPGHTGIIGPRYEHWYRNAALTLMADPNGSTFIEIPKVFTDTEYLKTKFKYLKDPTVIDFWTKEMGQTSDYHKSEMLGWFVSKFGAFQNNEIMRNIIGQTKSSFNIRDVMDQKKILIVNLSKGKIGELNSQLLGMIFVIKFQAAAMSRADIPEEQRSDFALYVDEFQNFSTDSFASILSEARKYRLNLIVANQFIGQLSAEIRDAVFGNIGTIVAHRMGPDDAEFMTKQFAPVFDAGDLVNLPNYQAAMRLMIGGLPSQPFTIMDSAPIGAPNAELGIAIKQLSAAKYGHNKAAVEADLAQRLTGVPSPAVPTATMPLPSNAPQPVAAVATPVAPVGATGGVVTPAPVPAPAPTAVAPAPATPAVPAAGMVAPAVPLASLAVAADTAATAPAGMAVAPPPIGAPPVDVVQTAVAPAPAAESAAPASDDPLAQMIALAKATDEAPAPAPLEVPIDPNITFTNAPAPTAEPAAVPTDAPAVVPEDAEAAGLVRTPPPIGAPPVDLDMPEPAPVKTAPAGTLSLDDITGHKRDIIEEDPYAAIDILGPAVPRVAKKPVSTEAADEPVAESAPIQAAATPEPAPRPSEPLAMPEPAAAEAPAMTVETQAAEPTPILEEGTAGEDSLMDGLPEGVHFLANPESLTGKAEPATESPAQPAVTPETNAMQQAEQEIDDLLSVSLLHPDQRLASLEVAADTVAEAPAPAMAAPVAAEQAVAAQPVAEPAPIVETALVTPPPAVVEAAPAPVVPAVAVAAPELDIKPMGFAPAVPQPEPSAENVATTPIVEPQPAPAPVVATPEQQSPAEPLEDSVVSTPAAPAVEQDMAIPQAEMLGAVGAVKTEQSEAEPEPVPETAPAPVAEPQSAPETEPLPEAAIEPAKIQNHSKRKNRKAKGGKDKPEATVKEDSAPAPEVTPDIAPTTDQPGKSPVAEEQAPANVPEVSAASPMPGSAIMPQASIEREIVFDQPELRPAEKVDEKSLKVGEVYVDSLGNVVIGTGAPATTTEIEKPGAASPAQ